MTLQETLALRTANLPQLSRNGRIDVPGYDRSALRAGIVHFGVGGFHRSHQAMYLDRLMSVQDANDWGVCGVGLLPGDQQMARVLADQDHLYTLVTKHSDGRDEVRVIGSIIDYLYAPQNPAAVLARLCAPTTRIVSLTITEGGYHVDQISGRFDPTAPQLAADLTGAAAPQTVFGYVIAALRSRRRDGIPPFTVLSCDNLPGNGHIAKEAFAGFAAAQDPELGDWIRANVAFPNCMVDRITPATTDADRAALTAEFGIADGWPVTAEPFTQWVIQDEFPMGRPAWEHVGVQMTDDVEPYELMKLRMLNAGHQAIGYAGYLCGHRYVDEAAADPVLAQFLLAYLQHEAEPTLPHVDGADLADYRGTLLARFANPRIKDTLARLCTDGSNRIPKFLVPVIRANLATGREIRHSAAIIAAWARYSAGIDEQGNHIDIDDPRHDELAVAATPDPDRPLAFIQNRALFGDIANHPRFATAYHDTLESIRRHGTRSTLEQLLSTSSK